MRVLTWNLYHGRDFPLDAALFTWRSRLLRATEQGATHVQVNRVLLDEFAGWLAGRAWDVALLQEAPPRWFRSLASLCRASGALALTSRNSLPALRRRLADWNPDLLASAEGGSNQLLVRGRVLEVRRMALTWLPERRRMLWARIELTEGELCVANVHASAKRPRKAAAEVEAAAERAVEWAGRTPLVFGGDFNLRPSHDREVFVRLRDRFALAEPTAAEAIAAEPLRDPIDHLLVRGLGIVDAPRRLPPQERELREPDGRLLRLSDHAPVEARFAPIAWVVGGEPPRTSFR
jgi:endonuclease/exonuclease/phosphatase family metal-dependent hydrolase